ncbi:hypothetical protein SEA_DUSTYDINO_35 [Microbacterium phage DustyDino]|nr:hypothetical protein SEA_DUSTYDINO_35 [Microbacterium phage DustyDino]
MKTYDIPARILVQLNEGPNPTLLSEFVIRAKEGGRKVNAEGVVSHQIPFSDVSHGLLLALGTRIREGHPVEVDYIKKSLNHMIGELNK